MNFALDGGKVVPETLTVAMVICLDARSRRRRNAVIEKEGKLVSDRITHEEKHFTALVVSHFLSSGLSIYVRVL